MGLDWDAVSKINPRAILAVGTAFGLEGPYADRVGFDGVAQAMSGAAYFSGIDEQPVRSAAPWVDFGTASLLALGVAAALRARETTGRGQMVEGALAAHGADLLPPTLIEEDALKLGSQAVAQPQPDGGAIGHLQGQGRLDHRGGERRSAVSPRRKADRRAGVARGSALRHRQGARRSWRDHQRARRRLGGGAHQRRSHRGVRRRARAGRTGLAPRQTLDDPHVQSRRFLRRASIFPASARRRSRRRRSSCTARRARSAAARRRWASTPTKSCASSAYSAIEIAALKKEGAV